MNLKNELLEAAKSVLKEGIESTADMIKQNGVQSFDDMGMANVVPGEFAQEEITDAQNLVNTAEMSNDTNFENKAEGPVDHEADVTNELVNISVKEIDNPCEDDHCGEGEDKVEHMLHHMFGEGTYGKFMNEILGGKDCLAYLSEASDFAGPKDYTQDMRINVSDVLNTLKNEIGEGSEGIHVDQVLDDQKNNAYKVSQVDKNKLPKNITVSTVSLELGDDDTYFVNKPSAANPVQK